MQIKLSTIQRYSVSLILGFCAFMMAGCGQKGALYLPTQPSETKSQTTQQVNNTDETQQQGGSNEF